MEPENYPGHVETVNNMVIMFVRAINHVVHQEFGTFPDASGMAELSQIFYFICLDIPQVLPRHAQMMVPVFEKSMVKQIEVVREGLMHMSGEVLEDGASMEDIIPYLYKLFVVVFTNQFPGEALLVIG